MGIGPVNYKNRAVSLRAIAPPLMGDAKLEEAVAEKASGSGLERRSA